MNILNCKHIHCVGIKGVGLTALALCVQDLGINVTGSDVEEEFVTDETLKKRGISWNVGFDEKHLEPRPDLVVTTGAHGGLNNPEVLAAKKLGIPVMTHEEALSAITQGREVIAVCGVGGKSTTSTMIATIFDVAGLHPSFAIGVGDIPSLGAPGRYDPEGKIFIVEADEYAVSPGVDNTPKFLYFNPKVIVVTNIEHDHPDIYPTIKETENAFRKFFEKVPSDGLLIVNENNQNAMGVVAGVDVPQKAYRIERYNLKVPGEFNQLNASGAAAASRFYGISEDKIKEGLKKFTGTRRRFEKVSEKDGVIFIDDYAHMPNEIQATLKAAKETYPGKRIVAIFQPHTYSRTKALFAPFTESFGYADVVGVMDIYASARESKDESITSEILAEAISENNENTEYTGGHESTAKWIDENTQNGDVVLTMGAGDIFKLYKYLK